MSRSEVAPRYVRDLVPRAVRPGCSSGRWSVAQAFAACQRNGAGGSAPALEPGQRTIANTEPLRRFRLHRGYLRVHTPTCLLLGAVLSAAGCSAAPPPESTPTLDYLEGGGELTIAFARDAAPFSFENTDGAPAGFEADIARAVAASLGADVSFLPVRSARLAIEQGAAALAFGAVEPDDGGVRPWFLDGVHVLGRTGSGGEVRDRIVAVLDPETEEIVRHAGGAPLRVDSAAIGLESVQDGRVDLLAADLGTLTAVLEPGVEIAGTRISSSPYGIITQPGQADLVRALDALVVTACGNGVWTDAYREWITPFTRLEPPPCPSPG